MITVRVNGVDLRTACSLYVERVGGLRSLPRRRLTATPPLGGAGALPGRPSPIEGRSLTITGVIAVAARTLAARESAEATLVDVLSGGLVEVRRDDGTTSRVIEGVCTDLTITPAGARDARVEIAIAASEAWWRSPEFTVRHLLVADTRYPLPLGTAPSPPIYLVQGTTGGNPPVLTVRHPGGTVLWTIELTALAADTFYEVDTPAGQIWQTASGVKTIANGALAAASRPVWRQPLDPKDGDYRSSQWPTLEVSDGTASVIYWKAWSR